MLATIKRKKMKIKIIASVNRIGATTERVLTEVGDALGIDEMVITSTQRTPRTQAEAMYANIAEGRNIRYKWAGEQVCNLCRTMRGQKKPKEEIIAAMTKRIEELSEQGYRVSKHCVSDAVYDRTNVIDVSYRNMQTAKAIEAIKAFAQRIEVVKIIQPVTAEVAIFDRGEPAIHLEIRQA